MKKGELSWLKIYYFCISFDATKQSQVMKFYLAIKYEIFWSELHWMLIFPLRRLKTTFQYFLLYHKNFYLKTFSYSLDYF